MSERLIQVIREINNLKRQLADLWETKQRTDADILRIADRLDRLLNEHDRLLVKNG